MDSDDCGSRPVDTDTFVVHLCDDDVGQTYVFHYRPETAELCKKTIGLCAADIDHPMTWNDAACLCAMINKQMNEHEDN